MQLSTRHESPSHKVLKQQLVGGSLVIALFCSLCSCTRKPAQPDIFGSWHGWIVPTVADGALPEEVQMPKLTWTLTLNKDGSYVEHFENLPMYEVIRNEVGKYAISGNKVTMTGTAKIHTDDGYGKTDKTEPTNAEYLIENGQLQRVGAMAEQAKLHDKIIVLFLRPGRKPVMPQPPPLPPSSPDAKALLARCSEMYAHLKTYRDEGTVQAGGIGFEAKSARFATRYIRGGDFLFEVTVMDDKGKGYEKNATWTKNGIGYVDYEDHGTLNVGKNDVRMFLGTLTVGSGSECDLVPGLLEPKKFGPAIFSPTIMDEKKAVTKEPDSIIDGHDCSTVTIRVSADYATTYWIDKSSLLIRRTFESFRKETINYKPVANAAISGKEFSPTPLKP